MTDWPRVRAEFPSLANWTFLNSATFGQLSRRTVDAVARHFADREATACHDFLRWFEDHDRLRAKLAAFIGATADEIAFIPNAATALGLLVRGLDWREGDEIVTLEHEFPNQIYGPKFLERRGVTTIECAWPEMLERIGPRTRMVAVSTVNYATGFRAPLEEIAEAARRRGAVFYVDGTQSLGALRFDWRGVRPDLFAVNCYKWMLAPNGAAFMAVSPELTERLEPAALGWRSHFDWRNVDNLHQGAPELKGTAEKFEGGMLPSSALYALEASVDLVDEIGQEEIEERVLKLAAQVRGICRGLGGEALPFDDSAIVAARFPGRDSATLSRGLKERRVLVSARHGYLRISPHFYNDESDIDSLREGLRVMLSTPV
jgi:selenocysteine lyase/cysteine desulfurase